MSKKQVSNCCGVQAIEYFHTAKGTYWCSRCTKNCIVVDEEEQFWDASVARAKNDRGMDWSKDNVYDAIGRPELKP